MKEISKSDDDSVVAQSQPLIHLRDLSKSLLLDPHSLPKVSHTETDILRVSPSANFTVEPTLNDEEDPSLAEVIAKQNHYVPPEKPSFSDRFFYFNTTGSLNTLIILHTLGTLIVFTHFFTKKWLQLEKSIPEAAPNYWAKHVIPPLEFGAMHALLLQLALLPLTMSRYFLTVLRSTFLKFYFPFEILIKSHIYLGYLVGVQLTVATIVFFGFFGSLCAEFKAGTEPVNFCEKLTSEIMITGLVILGVYYVILLTAAPFFCRRFKTFERFYYPHHFFIFFYFLTIFHTFDAPERAGTQEPARSQTWKWVIGPIIIYTVDRFLYILSRKRSRILSAVLYENPKAMVVTLEKPQGFGYKSGQYVHINIPSVSKLEWHPFSLASTNDEKYLKLYIRCCTKGWTEKVWNDLHNIKIPDDDEISPSVSLSESDSIRDVLLIGPYGAPAQDIGSFFDHYVFVCTGSGIVPILSHVKKIMSQIETRAEFLGLDMKTLIQRQRKFYKLAHPIGLPISKGTIAMICKSYVFSVVVFISFCVDFTFTFAQISWFANKVAGVTAAISKVQLLCGLVIHVMDVLGRMELSWIQKSKILSLARLMEWWMILVTSILGAVDISIIGLTKFNVTMVVLTSIVRAYRWLTLQYYNRLSHTLSQNESDSFANIQEDIVLLEKVVQSITIIWIAPEFDNFMWLKDELVEIQQVFDESAGPEFLKILINVTQESNSGMHKHYLSGTSLEKRVAFGRPDWDATLQSIRLKRLQDRRIGTTGLVTVSVKSVTTDLTMATMNHSIQYDDVKITMIDASERSMSLPYDYSQDK